MGVYSPYNFLELERVIRFKIGPSKLLNNGPFTDNPGPQDLGPSFFLNFRDCEIAQRVQDRHFYIKKNHFIEQIQPNIRDLMLRIAVPDGPSGWVGV